MSPLLNTNDQPLNPRFTVIEGGLSKCAGDFAMKRSIRGHIPVPTEVSNAPVRSKFTRNISYQTLDSSGPGVAHCSTPVVPTSRKHNGEIVPISNIPSVPVNADADLPSQRDFTVYRLKNRVSELRQREKQLLAKLTLCQEILTSEKRFFENGLFYDQWETYDEMLRRKSRLAETINAISDPNCNPQRIRTPEEIEKIKSEL